MAGDSPTAKFLPMAAGQRYGRLTLVELLRRDQHGTAYWRVRCDCGNVKVVDVSNVRRRSTVSCGCHRKERMIRKNTTHGLKRTPEYKAWDSMRQRCANPRSAAFRNYGARGISVCERWLNSVETFYADMGPRPSPQHSLDRIDNDGNYEPGNCRWATPKEQANNRR